MSLYSVSKLMNETRRLACEYYQTTGQVLPITQELAKFDAITLLDLDKPQNDAPGIDALGKAGKLENQNLLIKGRVILPKQRTAHRIGQLNVNSPWDYLLLVLYDDSYEPDEVYSMSKDVIAEILENKQKKNKRGMLSINQIKAVGECLWQSEANN